MSKAAPIVVGNTYGRWTILGPIDGRDAWVGRCPCGGEADLPVHTIRARSRKCPACGGPGKDNSVAVLPDASSTIATPADRAAEWIVSSVAASPLMWHPWGAYRDRGHRAEPGQLGTVIGRSGNAFPWRLREAGLPTTGCHRERLPSDIEGKLLPTRPIAAVLPPDVWDAWCAEWPGAHTSLAEPKPAEPVQQPRDACADRVRDFLRLHGGSFVMADIGKALHIRGGMLHVAVVHADDLVTRRISGAGTRRMLYLDAPEFPPIPDLAPRDPTRSYTVVRGRSVRRIPPEDLIQLISDAGGTVRLCDAVKDLGLNSAYVINLALKETDKVTRGRAGKFVTLTIADAE